MERPDFSQYKLYNRHESVAEKEFRSDLEKYTDWLEKEFRLAKERIRALEGFFRKEQPSDYSI